MPLRLPRRRTRLDLLSGLRSAMPVIACFGLLVFAENTALESFLTMRKIAQSPSSAALIAGRQVTSQMVLADVAWQKLHERSRSGFTDADAEKFAGMLDRLLPLAEEAEATAYNTGQRTLAARLEEIVAAGQGTADHLQRGLGATGGSYAVLEADIGRLLGKLRELGREIERQSAAQIHLQAQTLRDGQMALGKMLVALGGALFSILVLLYLNRREQRRAAFRADHDPTTGLLNRPAVERWCERYEADARRVPVALMIVGIDDFSELNDEFGYRAGDDVLRQMATTITGHFGPTATVVRWGGDEFLVAVPIDGCFEAGAVATLRSGFARLQMTVNAGDAEVGIRCSAGAALCPQDSESLGEALQFAQLALYRAKTRGKARLDFYDTDVLSERHRTVSLRDRLRSAIRQGELVLHWQPQVDILYPHVPSVEALIRWFDPRTERMVPPGEFIPAAESSDLIIEIDLFVLDGAIRTGARWAELWAHPPTVAVNISATHFQHRDFVAQVRDMLRRYGLPPAQLELEITEGVILGDNAEVKRNLEGLAALGVRLALDDFGTGYSNIAYLSQLRPDRLKIDQTFVRGLQDSEQMRSLVSAMIGIGKAIDCEVLAEGVETPEDVEALRQLGCQLVQGYHFARPMPAEVFEAWRDSHFDDAATALQLRRIAAFGKAELSRRTGRAR